MQGVQDASGSRLSESLIRVGLRIATRSVFRPPYIAVDKVTEVEKEQFGELVAASQDDNFGDVLVVGGGISGIQASLDLATAGFRVHLVEKGPSIGGHMAQLDKTFPTNDCSM